MSSLQAAIKIPLRLRNLTLLKTPYYSKRIAGTPFDVIAERGKFRLLKFSPGRGTSKKEVPLLMVPSLINRYYILDLYSGCSVVESLIDQGYDVYLLDWGEPRPQDKYLTLSDHIENGLEWAAKKTLGHSNKERFHLFGQCLGGTLACLYSALRPTTVESLILLTTPIDFHVEGTFINWAKKSDLNLDRMIETWGNIQAEFLDQSFKMMSPLSSVKQKANLWQLGWDKAFLKKHVAITSWVKDSVPFPGRAYKDLIEKFYLENEVYEERFLVRGQNLPFENLTMPILSMMAKGDTIVPNGSSKALKDKINHHNYNEAYLSGGHIGSVVGDRGFSQLSENLTQWLEFV